jgi:hypothetical protein
MNLVGAMLSGCMPIPQDGVAEQKVEESEKLHLERE